MLRPGNVSFSKPPSIVFDVKIVFYFKYNYFSPSLFCIFFRVVMFCALNIFIADVVK